MIEQLKSEDFFEANYLLQDFNIQIDSNYYKNDFNRCIIYREDNKIKGILLYSFIYDRIEINYIIVNRLYQKKGIATKLLNYLFIIHKNIINITLEVRQSNKIAISFYKKNLFKVASIRKNYYGNEDGILMIREV